MSSGRIDKEQRRRLEGINPIADIPSDATAEGEVNLQNPFAGGRLPLWERLIGGNSRGWKIRPEHDGALFGSAEQLPSLPVDAASGPT